MRKKSLLTTLLTLVAVCLMALGLAACNNAPTPPPVPDSDPVNFTVTVQTPDGSAATGVNAQLGNATQKLTAAAVDADGKAVIDVKSLLTDGADTLYLWLSDLPAEYIFAKADGTEYGAEGMAVTAVIDKTPVTTSATVKLTAKPEPEPEPEPVELGVFARKWFDGEYVLDLTAGTLSGYAAFEATAIEGTAADTVISCTADGLDMTLVLNDEGKLELCLTDDADTVLRTFMPDPAAFAGSWVEEDNDWAYIYFSVSAIPNDDGNYVLGQYSAYNGEEVDSNPAYTRMQFDEDGNVVLVCYDLYESSFGDFTYNTMTLTADGVMTLQDQYDFKYTVVPFSFELFENYITAENKAVDFDTENNTLTYDGTEVAYELAQTELGAGYVFTANGTKYALVHTPAGILLQSANKTIDIVAADPAQINGDWTFASGGAQMIVTDGNKATVKVSAAQTDVALTPAYEDGKVVYNFTYEGRGGKLFALDEYGSGLSVTTTTVALNGYFFSTEERNKFFEVYTDNCNTIQISADGKITVADLITENAQPDVYQGRFTYLALLNSMAFEYSNNGTTSYIILLDDGVLWEGSVEEGRFSVQESWLTESAAEKFSALFLQGLDETDKNDVYTTGVNGNTISFEFSQEIGQTGYVLFNGTKAPFFWDIAVQGELLVPTLYFPIIVENGDNTEYHICTLGLNGYGLYLEQIILPDLNDPSQFDEADTLLFVAKSALENHLGRTYSFVGEYYNETLTLTENGEFWIDSTAPFGSDDPIKSMKYNYTLQHNDNGFVVMFDSGNTLYLYVYLHESGLYATLMDIVYTAEAYTEFVGTYYADNGDQFVFDAKGGVSYTKAEKLPIIGSVKSDFVLGKEGEQNKLTANVTLDSIDYSLAIVNGVATLTPTEGAAIALTKKQPDPLAFVGSYTVGTGDDAVTFTIGAAATGVNFKPTLSVTASDGGIYTAALTFDQEGNQVCTLSKFLSTEQYVLTYNGTTLTLNDGAATTIVKQSVFADYSAFIFATPVSNDDHTLTCIVKEYNGISVPYFYLDGSVCASYSVTAQADGALVLTMISGGNEVTVTRAADGTVTATLPTPAPLPPVPPPPAAPPLP